MHACLNAIAGRPGRPGCVLIRALEPVAGTAAMAARRGVPAGAVGLTNGPAKLTQALAITLRDSGADLTRDLVRGRLTIARGDRTGLRIATGPRIGITRATELPLRFWIRGNRYVSRG
jgi:DNA-3-methyladenine glycosylase